jgi:hypothetical protein
LDLSAFEFVSFHAPSRYAHDDETQVLSHLTSVVNRGIPVVVPPDVIYSVSKWACLGPHLLIENMDKRKEIGQTASNLRELFHSLPDARFCFDIGHARQVDPTMLESRLILDCARNRLAQVHISEVNTASHHDPISAYAIAAFRRVASLFRKTSLSFWNPLSIGARATFPPRSSAPAAHWKSPR